jgi:hypothetical protein
MEYLAWPSGPIPGNASATGKFRMPNGVYALYHPDGSLRFLCRIVAAQVDCWLNLAADSGHFDEGNSGEAYYKDGRMETFSPWDDSAPFRAKESFAEWRDRCIGQVSRPVPPDVPESLDLELRDLRASCAKNFRDLDPEADWRLRLLAFLRRCQFGLPGYAESLSSWTETVRTQALIKPPWDQLLIEELPICAAPRPGRWRPDWSGVFAWRPEPPGWLLQTVAAFKPPLVELGSLRQLAAFPGPGADGPLCRLRGLIFACELLCHLGEAQSAIGLARTLEPSAEFEPQLAPWCDFPEELEMWQLDWETCAVEPFTWRHRAQVGVILERLGMRPT